MNSYLRLPGVEEKLAKIFPNMRVFGTHWFQGDKPNAEYSGWHTGIFQSNFSLLSKMLLLFQLLFRFIDSKSNRN